MRKLIIAAVALLTISIAVCAQNYVKVENKFIQIDKKPKKIKTYQTGYFYVIDGTDHPIYRTENNKYFILRTSRRTNKQYKQYLKIKELENGNPTIQKRRESIDDGYLR